jgi:hypothetical protein
MNAKRIRPLICSVAMGLCFVILAGCRRSGDVNRAASQTASPWTLTLAGPIDHLDLVAREPMIVEHPDGTLFIAGYGAAWISGKPTDEPTLWKSTDGGTSWGRVNVGTEADGAAGNSDPDLVMAGDGTLYFVTMLFDREKGNQISVGVSKDVGTTWKWTLLSKDRFDDRPWVKVAPDGTAHVIWNDGAGVCHAVSTDGGLTWTERTRIHPKGGSSHLTVGPNGEVAVRVMPPSASGIKHDEGVDLIAVSTDGGTTWGKEPAPGYREWTPGSNYPIMRWVEPLAWDARGALYSFWTNLKGIWLARSVDQGATWTTWQLAENPDLAYFPYLVARGAGELAATWFSGWTLTWQAHFARIDIGEDGAPPRMVESLPFRPDSWQRDREWPEDIREEIQLLLGNDLQTPDTAGEYLPILFLRNGGLAVVSPIQNWREKRFGFSLWRVEERR